jgi:outer membrane biosynthesis protein TonB
MFLAIAGAILGGVLGLCVDAQRDGSLVARALHLPKLTTHAATAVVQPTLPPPAKSVLLPPVEAIVFAAPKTESPAKPPEVKVEASPKPEKEKPTKSARPKWHASPRYAPAKAPKADVPKAPAEAPKQDPPKGPTDANKVLQDAMKDTANTL